MRRLQLGLRWVRLVRRHQSVRSGQRRVGIRPVERRLPFWLGELRRGVSTAADASTAANASTAADASIAADASAAGLRAVHNVREVQHAVLVRLVRSVKQRPARLVPGGDNHLGEPARSRHLQRTGQFLDQLREQVSDASAADELRRVPDVREVQHSRRVRMVRREQHVRS